MACTYIIVLNTLPTESNTKTPEKQQQTMQQIRHMTRLCFDVLVAVLYVAHTEVSPTPALGHHTHSVTVLDTSVPLGSCPLSPVCVYRPHTPHPVSLFRLSKSWL